VAALKSVVDPNPLERTDAILVGVDDGLCRRYHGAPGATIEALRDFEGRSKR
jgi:hypothetical protein